MSEQPTDADRERDLDADLAVCEGADELRAERDRLADQLRYAKYALASLSSWLGNGMGDESVSAFDFEQRIRDGVDTMLRVETERRERAEQERDQLAMMAREVTCVWCGHQFVTKLQSQADELYQHAKVCEKHPVRAAEAERDRLRAVIQARADGCSQCKGTGREPSSVYDHKTDSFETSYRAGKPCQVCRWAREALEGGR